MVRNQHLPSIEYHQHTKTIQAKQHEKILPVVRNQHLLHCTLLIGNAATMEALPIFVDSLITAWEQEVFPPRQIHCTHHVFPPQIHATPSFILNLSFRSSSMAENSDQPRRKLIIKFYLPESEKREEGWCEKTCFKSKPKCSTEYSSRVISKVCELKKRKEGAGNTNKRELKNENKRELKDEKEGEFKNDKRSEFKCNTNKRKLKNEKEGMRKSNKGRTVMMDRCKKMQCWVILKRLMVRRDVWALKQPILDNKSRSRKTRLMCLEDIESNLKKSKYSKVDEFVDDMRLVFSYALQYPPRSEIYKTARRISDTFELHWKNFKLK
ncbi:hypothetical protein Fmac_021496 [Flemingia macrophylla]|uniref:Bromo domain-containing protein n=1 Tax=Flemingia macrophylla TaxID=520843 RepID=A0ABD1LX11_9FABA